MSSPPNPLDSYRSYSYHHILVACDGTATANALVDAPLSAYDHHPSEKYCPKSIGGGSYVVLINGMSDAQFFIREVKWSSVLTPRTSNREQSHASTTMALDGEMEIIEPRGVNFYNLLNQVTKSLRIDPSSMVYVLKTVFVGITDVGTEEYITTIKPLPFILTDITSNFDYTGAQYNVSFVGMYNGAGKMPGANSIVQGFTYTIKSNQSVYAALKGVEATINALYETERKSAIRGASACGADFDAETLANEFMDVRYVIEPDEIYKDKGYIAGDLYNAARQDTGNNDSHISDFGEATSIERIIDEVMRSSKKVVEDGQGEATSDVKTSQRFTYKITSEVEIDRELSLYTVTYRVSRYVGTVVKSDEIETFVPKGPDGVTDVGIEFDYIFTGQNVDVVDFNLSMQYGLTFLQMLGANSSCPTSRLDTKMFSNPDTIVAGGGNKDGAGDQKSPNAYCSIESQTSDDYVKKPLFLGRMVSHPSFRDMRSPAATASFNTLLHRIAALENIGAKMKIRGNPQLLEDTNIQRNDILAEVPELSTNIPNSDGPLMPNLNRVPGYVKVNVMMPSSWQMDDTSNTSNEGTIRSAAGDYANYFWYKGWYMLLQIDHVFSEGEFTQELEIYSLPTDAGQSKMGTCIDEKIQAAKADPTKQATPKPADTSEGVPREGQTVGAAMGEADGSGK